MKNEKAEKDVVKVNGIFFFFHCHHRHSSLALFFQIGDDEESSTSLVEEVKRLSASQDLRRGQIRRVSVELRAAQQRLKQLNATIRLKVNLFPTSVYLYIFLLFFLSLYLFILLLLPLLLLLLFLWLLLILCV